VNEARSPESAGTYAGNPTVASPPFGSFGCLSDSLEAIARADIKLRRGLRAP